jgi:hypothetical protein
MIVGNLVAQIIGSLFFFTRAYSRIAIIKAWRLEDHVLTLAWVSHVKITLKYSICLILRQVFCTGYSVCQYGQIANGAGRHAAALFAQHLDTPITSQKYAYAAQIIVFPALAVPKMSICLTYLRVFDADIRGRYMIRALLILLVLLTFPFMFEVAFQCNPVHVYWSEGRPADKCIADFAGFLLSGSLNIFVDVALMAIVLPRVLRMQLHQRQRWALAGIVLVGTLAAVAGIVRMVRVSRSLALPNFEPSWDQYDISIWQSTEIYVSLLCASAPGIKPAVKKILPKLLGSYSSRYRTRTTGGESVGIELGLGPNWKRATIGSARVHNRRLNESVLDTADGPYTEFGSDIDARSTGRNSIDRPATTTTVGERSQRGHVHKTSEVSVQTQAV